MKFRKLSITKKNRKYLTYSSIFLLILLLLFLFKKQSISIIFSIMLIIVGSMSNLFKRITGINVGIEFITFATIIFLYSYGPVFALATCLLMLIISSLSTGQIAPTTFTSFGMYCIIALISMFMDFGIVANGIILMLVMNLLGLLILFILGFDFVRNFIYISGNVFFNYILFKYFSEIIFYLLI